MKEKSEVKKREWVNNYLFYGGRLVAQLVAQFVDTHANSTDAPFWEVIVHDTRAPWDNLGVWLTRELAAKEAERNYTETA